MATETQTLVELPKWVRKAIESGEPMAALPNKRRDLRRVCVEAFIVHPENRPTAERFSVRGFNVNSHGIGFISERELVVGLRLALAPAGDLDEPPIWVRVVHCTETAEGHKVGCAFAST